MGAKFTVKNFSVVVPVFNEEEIILHSAAQIYDLCKRKNLDFLFPISFKIFFTKTPL